MATHQPMSHVSQDNDYEVCCFLECDIMRWGQIPTDISEECTMPVNRLQGSPNLKATCPSETSVTFYQTAECCVPEVGKLHETYLVCAVCHYCTFCALTSSVFSVLQSVESQPLFQRNLSPLSLGLKSKTVRKAAQIWQQAELLTEAWDCMGTKGPWKPSCLYCHSKPVGYATVGFQGSLCSCIMPLVSFAACFILVSCFAYA